MTHIDLFSHINVLLCYVEGLIACYVGKQR